MNHNSFHRNHPVAFYTLAIIILIVLLTAIHYFFVADLFDYANKDFMSLWAGGKAVLTGQNPYDPDVWLTLRTEHGSIWFPDDRAPFPLWTFLFTVPFALLPIPLAAALWMALTELVLVASIFLVVVKLVGYRPTINESLMLLLTVILSIITLLVLINGQMTAFLLAVLVGYLLLIKAERPFTAGLLLALLAVKPNAFIAFIPLLGIWLLARRRWRTIGGGFTGFLIMLATTWLLQPGWLLAWLNVRGKTAVITITPTIWGLAAELAGTWWLLIGLLFTALIVGTVGWYVLNNKQLGDAPVVSLALAVSLLTTPYAWSYEHALLYLPWAWVFAITPIRKQANMLWLSLALIIPWLLFIIAAIRINDSLAFISPLLAIFAILYAQKQIR